MNHLLLKMFALPIEGHQPHIEELKQPMFVMGMMMNTDLRHIARDVSMLGRRLEAFKKTHGIPNRQEPWAFAAVSSRHDPATGKQSYMMGDVVTSLGQVPDGLVGTEIPAGTYTVFSVRPRNRFGWPFAIADVKRYAYSVWMPRSGFEPAGTIDDFEYHDERSTRKRDPQVDLYVAVKRKS